MVGMCMVDPGMDYFRNVSDGEGEAIMLRGLHEMRRQNNNGK